jgi:hypothetical protein
MPCSSETARYFWGTYRPHLQVKNKSSKKPAEAGSKLIHFQNMKTEVIVSSEIWDSYQTIRCYDSEDRTLHNYHLESHKLTKL